MSSPPSNQPPPSSKPARVSRKDRRGSRPATKKLGESSNKFDWGRHNSGSAPGSPVPKAPGVRRVNTGGSFGRSRRITAQEEDEMLATKITLKDLPSSIHGEEEELSGIAAALRRKTSPPGSFGKSASSADTFEHSSDDLLSDDPKDHSMGSPGTQHSKKTPSMMGASLRSCASRYRADTEDSDSDSMDLGMSMGLARYATGLGSATPAATTSSSTKKSGRPALDDHLNIRKSAMNLLESLSNSVHTMQSLKDLHMSFAQRNKDQDDDSNSSDDLVEFEDDIIDDDEEGDKNPFSKRQDLREVDQSCNLMDVQTGMYEWSGKGSKKNQHNRSMIELFLGIGGSTRSEASGNGNNGGGRKPPKKRKKPSCLSKFCNGFCSKSFLLFVGVAAAFAILVAPLLWSTLMSSMSTSKGGNTTAPTSAPTSLPQEENSLPEAGLATITNSPYFSAEEVQERQQALAELLVSMDNAEAVTDSLAAQKANSWIAAYDPAQMDILPFEDNGAENYGIMERYILSVLFFTTNPQVPAATAPHTSISSRTASSSKTPEKQQQAKDEELNRRELFQLTFLDWMTAPHICSWEGITCDELKFVVGIDLSNSKLHGTLPPELGLLMESLTEIDLSENRLRGEVPSGWGKFKALETLKLHDNELTGTVDDGICGTESLVTFTTDCIDEVECDCCTKCY